MRRTVLTAMAAACLAALGAAAPAQVSLPPAADASERALLPEVGALIGGGHADLPRLDALLARLPNPTPLRGFIQLARAVELDKADRAAPAQAAAEEAVRLLPSQPGPKLLLSAILTFAGEPGRAADLWLEASRIAPDMTREGDAYILNALIGRLNDAGDHDRADALRARMAEIGFVASLAPVRSDAAVAQVNQAMARKDAAAAQAALREVLAPGDLELFWVDKRFAPLWPAIAEVGGPSLAEAHLRWLKALRAEWQRDRNFETATNYARALVRVRQYASVVALFRPLVDAAVADEQDPHLWFLAPVVARSLAETGKAGEARALLERLAHGRAAGPGDAAMRLNATGNLANLSFLAQRWTEAAAEAGDWLTAAQAFGPGVNQSAILTVSAVRACALVKAGDADAAAPLIGEMMLHQRTLPKPAFDYRLCSGDLPGARALIIDRLADESTRAWALGEIQPRGAPGLLPEEAAESAMLAALARDPAVRAAAAAVGRILPAPVAVELPAGFDPDGASRPPSPDSI